MDKEEHKKHFNNPCWVTYLNPFRIIVPDDEEPLKVELEEVNSNTYNHGKLCRIVSNLSVTNFDYKLLICYDGALAIPKYGNFSEKEKAVDLFNNVFCELLLGGVDCECIDRRDLVNGQLHEKRVIWPVDFGNSASSQMHSKLRMRVSSNLDSIILTNPNSIYISEFLEKASRGKEILDFIPNLTPKFLLRGVTEIRYRNWDLVLSNLWITVEQLIDFLWYSCFLDEEQYHPIKSIDGRKYSLKNDNRTWSTSVKQELLFQIGILDEEIISNLHPARKARNKLVHEGKGVSERVATDLVIVVELLLKKVTQKEEIVLSKYINETWESRMDKSNFDKEYFEDWREN